MSFDKKAYQRELMRERRKIAKESKNLPVPVLAEVDKSPVDATEARESNESVRDSCPTNETWDSRGGQNDGVPVERFESVEGSTPSAPSPTADESEKRDVEPSTAIGTAIPERKLTRVDKLFDAYRPNWYIFGKEVRKVECWECKKSYTTTLEMNRFCSPKCKNTFLDATFGKRMGR